MRGAARKYFRNELHATASVARDSLQLLSDPISELAEAISHSLRIGGKVLFCGNGGSAADAQHMAAEYVVRFQNERRPLAALALTTDTSLLTACANDYGYDTVFARQVQALGQAGDVLVLYSTSGNSRNLIEAARMGKAKQLYVAALLAGDGGELADEVDLAIVVPTTSTPRAQEIHLAIGHAICGWLEQGLEGPST